MESASDGAAAAQPPSSSDNDNDENNSPSFHHQFSSQVDQALLTQLPPSAGNNDNYCNTQSSMPSESQCSQPMLATQPAYNDSLLQTQLSRYNDHDDDEEEDAPGSQSQCSTQLLLTTQPTNHRDADDLPMKDDVSEANIQENSSQLEHLSMTQQQQSLLTQPQQQHYLASANDEDNEFERTSKQSHDAGDENNDDTDDAMMSTQDQRINENGHEVEFLYNTQQNNNEFNDDDDDDDSDHDDMERLVEEQNLAVSLSMEVIEECEESQRSRDKEALSPSQFCDVNNSGTVNDDNFNDAPDGQIAMKDADDTDLSSSQSGNANAANDDEMAKADKLLAEHDEKEKDYDYEEQDEPYNPPSSGLGFTNVGSGKSITVGEEEMAKADKLLADDKQQKSCDHDYEEQDEPCNPPPTGLGFTNVGSGKSITVNEEEMAKADKLLAEKSCDNGLDYEEQDEPCNPPSSGFGFTNVGSGKSITVNEDEMAKADKLLADDDKTISSSSMEAEVAVPKMTPKYQQNHQDKRTTVTNPYARKRSIDQISTAGAGKPNAATTAETPGTFAAPTPSRKLVFNPYAKTVQSTTKTVVRNPYAKVSTASAAPATNPSLVIPSPSRQLHPSSSSTNNTITQNTTNTAAAVLPTAKEETQFRFKGISFSLPIAERLPSRNVSYKPAEILTVDELHRYLYGANAVPANDFKDLQSVRITGTLLSVAVSCNDEKDGSMGDLYSSGTFLLIGDPLEKNRFPAKPLPQKQQISSSQRNVNSIAPRTVTKSRPTSILRNKHTPIVRTTQPTLSSNTDDEPVITPAVAKQSTQPVTTSIMKKPSLRGGLLKNNTKPKKFVYAGNKSRSSLGGGLHRKFVTPKRDSTLTVPNTTGRVTSSVIRNRPPSLGKTVSVSSGRRNNVKIETVIEVHPSPLVPVWIGSSLDDDGLDGSVVNDLVMVMGEIVVEHCTRCREQNDDGQAGANGDPTAAEESEDNGQDAQNDASAVKLQATAVKNVGDAALAISATASKCTESTCQTAKKRSFCGQCVCFLSARIVKNANGTDMNLQKESLRVRREYFTKRKKQMESLVQGMATSPALYSVGCGPFLNDKATVGSN